MKTTMIFDKNFIKFIFVGIFNTVLGSSIMFLLYNAAHLSYWVSSVCNHLLASILSFFLNKYFTFGVRQCSLFMVFTFILTIAASYIAAYGIAKPAMNYFLQNRPQNIRENAALCAGMCLFTGINYLGQRFFVFNIESGNNNEKK